MALSMLGYVGDLKTTVKDRKKEIGKGLLIKMLADIGIDESEKRLNGWTYAGINAPPWNGCVRKHGWLRTTLAHCSSSACERDGSGKPLNSDAREGVAGMKDSARYVRRLGCRDLALTTELHSLRTSWAGSTSHPRRRPRR